MTTAELATHDHRTARELSSIRSDETATGERRYPLSLSTKWGLLNSLDYYSHVASAIAARRMLRARAMRAWGGGCETGVVWGPNGHRWMKSPRGTVCHMTRTEAHDLFAEWCSQARAAAQRLTEFEDSLMTAEERRVCSLLTNATTGEEYKSTFEAQADVIRKRRAPTWLIYQW